MRLYGPTSSGPQRSLSRAAALGELEGKTIGILQNIARILGVAGYPFLMVRHPIGSCTLMELQERAEDAYRQALPILLSD